jgi:nitric oxide reductase subunit B
MIQEKRELLVSRSWIQAVIVVGLFGFLILGILAYRTYSDEPPIPSRVIGPDKHLIFTGEDITAGQEVFLKNGVMEYGSIFGHGAYLGPDFTTDYLHRAALISINEYGGASHDSARQNTIADFKKNQYDASSKTLTYTAAQSKAFEQLVAHYGEFFSAPDTRNGLRPSAITDPQQIRQLTAFFSWSAWTSSALRPGLDYSYTNNWPPEPLVGNKPTADALVWSVLSLIALLGGTGLLLAAFGRWNFLGWHGREDRRFSFRRPDSVVLTPAQRSCAWFFLIMAGMFLVQTLLGGATEHYRAELSDFFGFDLARILPYNLPAHGIFSCRCS